VAAIAVIYLLMAIVVIALVALSLIWLLTRRERYRRSHPTAGQLPTTEVVIDPETGRRQRVYSDPRTGERSYVDEPSDAMSITKR
jgi:hypothetical protein